jgi:hypothetical protein
MDILEAADMFHNRPGKDSRQENDFFGEIYETYRNEMFYVAYGILHHFTTFP